MRGDEEREERAVFVVGEVGEEGDVPMEEPWLRLTASKILSRSKRVEPLVGDPPKGGISGREEFLACDSRGRTQGALVSSGKKTEGWPGCSGIGERRRDPKIPSALLRLRGRRGGGVGVSARRS